MAKLVKTPLRGGSAYVYPLSYKGLPITNTVLIISDHLLNLCYTYTHIYTDTHRHTHRHTDRWTDRHIRTHNYHGNLKFVPVADIIITTDRSCDHTTIM